MERFGLSCEDAYDRDQWRLRIKQETSEPWFTLKISIKMTCA